MSDFYFILFQRTYAILILYLKFFLKIHVLFKLLFQVR